jgi:hypothetical protein
MPSTKAIKAPAAGKLDQHHYYKSSAHRCHGRPARGNATDLPPISKNNNTSPGKRQEPALDSSSPATTVGQKVFFLSIPFN